MTWFKVDDRFPESDKTIELTLRPEGLAAIGLWTLCGAWSAGRGNGGRITTAVVKRFRGTKKMVAALVEVGLWDPSDDEWQFHDWADYNESAETAQAIKAAEREAGKRGNHERWHAKRGITVPDCPYCVATPKENPSGGDRVPDTSPESGAIPPGPGPDPDPDPDKDQIDPTTSATSVLEADAPALEDDLQGDFSALGVTSRSARERVCVAVRRVVSGASDAEVVDVVRELLTLADGHVQHPVAYVETACRQTPATVQGIWARVPKPTGAAA